MTVKKEIYKCNVCGNIVEVLHAGVGELVCCGQPMQLLEEKTALQSGLNQSMQRTGKIITAPPITTTTDRAQVAPPAVDIGLKGRINAVNLETNLAEISIGAANGVKQGMRFHAIRGDKFICDIVIFEVDPDKAIGKLELIQETPKAGDIVSTNL